MKYIAIINTDEPLTEHTIQFIKDTIFCGDEQTPYVFEIEDIKYKAESKPQESIEKESIPYLMHKKLDIPISECQKAYNIGIEYLRSQARVKG